MIVERNVLWFVSICGCTTTDADTMAVTLALTLLKTIPVH